MDKKEILNERTFVELHMLQTIDGKATGNFWSRPDVWQGVRECYKIMPELKPQGFAMGRISMDMYSNETPKLSKYKNKPKIDHTDYVVPLQKGIEYYFASYDSKGTLGFKSNIINIREWMNEGGKMLSQVIEVLTDDVSNEYLHYCQEKQISYIFAGKKKIDIKTSLIKLKKLFGIDKILLEGGPVLDGAFINDNLIDALSIMISPLTSAGGDTLFNPSKYMEFKLVGFRQLSNSNIWLHYVKKK